MIKFKYKEMSILIKLKVKRLKENGGFYYILFRRRCIPSNEFNM